MRARMPRAPVAAAWLLVVVGAFGCRDRRSAQAQRLDAAPATSEPQPPRPADVHHIFERALSAIRERVGAKASVLVLELTPSRATIQVEAPTRRGHVVQYEWIDGTIRGPIAVELRGRGNLEQNLFPLAAVELSQIPALAKTAVDRIDREHGRVERIIVRRNLPAEEAIGIRVYVDSPIRSSHVDADARGRLVENPRVP